MQLLAGALLERPPGPKYAPRFGSRSWPPRTRSRSLGHSPNGARASRTASSWRYVLPRSVLEPAGRASSHHGAARRWPGLAIEGDREPPSVPARPGHGGQRSPRGPAIGSVFGATSIGYHERDGTRIVWRADRALGTSRRAELRADARHRRGFRPGERSRSAKVTSPTDRSARRGFGARFRTRSFSTSSTGLQASEADTRVRHDRLATIVS